MDRESIIVFVFIAIAVLLPALLPRSPNPPARHSNRRLRQPPSTSEDGSNVTCRHAELFPQVDEDPPDGFLSRHELIRWNLRHPQREFLRLSRTEMRLRDKNHDGFASFSEYYPPSRLQSAGNCYYGYDHMGRRKEERFNVSNADGDGRLKLTEFNEERDTDRDGKISFQEFYLGLFDLARKYDEGSTQHYEGSRDARARALFGQLDKDGDGYLSHLELLPVIGKIHPSEYYYAKQQADYIISKDDSDKDGRLTFTEITKKPCQFYRGMDNDYEDEYDSHDDSY